MVMDETSPNPKRPSDVTREPSPGEGLTMTLWVVAVMIAVLQVTWWWAVSMYS